MSGRIGFSGFLFALCFRGRSGAREGESSGRGRVRRERRFLRRTGTGCASSSRRRRRIRSWTAERADPGCDVRPCRGKVFVVRIVVERVVEPSPGASNLFLHEQEFVEPGEFFGVVAEREAEVVDFDLAAVGRDAVRLNALQSLLSAFRIDSRGEREEKTCNVGDVVNDEFLHHGDRIGCGRVVAESIHHRRHCITGPVSVSVQGETGRGWYLQSLAKRPFFVILRCATCLAPPC